MAGASPERPASAVQSVLEQLVHRDDGLVLLFTPPFDRTPFDPGYIKGYLPGIRENGGQYTHAAAWLIQALAQLGRQNEALAIFDLVNPIRKAASEAQVASYQTEPYAVAADIYSAASHVGRGGWTWYTGSASWLYRVALESLLGLELKGSHLRLYPRLPTDWPGFELTYRYRQTTLRFIVTRDAKAEQTGIDIKLPSDGRDHEFRVAAG
jgi:cyclic beta-1,2-glucan synthetase